MSRQSILLFGGSGMLGRRLVPELRGRGHHVIAPTHAEADIGTHMAPYIWSYEPRPDLIINCAGMVPTRSAGASLMVTANALAPHVIAEVAADRGTKVIHISTDCVFDGREGNYRDSDRPRPHHDLYSMTKASGEVEAARVLNVRTSFIGPEHGLWQWLVSQPPGGKVEGWASAWWTGSTVWAVVQALADMIDAGVDTGRTVHLSTREKVSKLEVCLLLNRILALGLEIKAVSEPRIDRSLVPTPGLPLLMPVGEAMRGVANAARD